MSQKNTTQPSYKIYRFYALTGSTNPSVNWTDTGEESNALTPFILTEMRNIAAVVVVVVVVVVGIVAAVAVAVAAAAADVDSVVDSINLLIVYHRQSLRRHHHRR
uniref:Uncharacterized protein n=1 Tax=Glossina pallidipes TaxID=7398 RepID=A0A1B0A158_GLOPL